MSRHPASLPLALAALALLPPLASRSAEPAPPGEGAVRAPSADLVVHASGFRDARGHAVARLFLPGENVRGKSGTVARAEIRGGAASLTFPALPAGRYAVVVFHDEDDSGDLEHGVFGPKEPIGFSNGFRIRLLSLVPTFDKLAFTFEPGRTHLDVEVR